MSSDEFRTPSKLFEELDFFYKFFLDACCTKDNCLVNSLIDYEEYDYLNFNVVEYYNYLRIMQDRDGEHSIFMNPPYSDPLPFIKKAWDDSKYFKVVMLLKFDPTTNWFNYAIETDISIHPVYEHQFQFKNKKLQSITSCLQGLENKMRGEKTSVGILPLRKRIKFYTKEGIVSKHSANFPSMIMVFDRTREQSG